MHKKTLLVLLALFSIALYTNLSANTAYKPIHLDEYDHLAIARESFEMQRIISYNPYIESHPEQGFFHSRFEASFDALLVILMTLLPIKAINITLPFTILVSTLIALGAFLFARKIFNSELAALIMAASVFLIENNFPFLGYLFAAPMSLASAMLVILAYLFIKSTDSSKYFLVFLLVLANSLFIHPIFSIMLLVSAAVFFALRPKTALKNKGKIAAGAVALIAVIAFIMLFTEFSLLEMVFWKYDEYAAAYPLLEFIGLPIAVLALLGTIYLAFSMIKKGFSEEQKKYGLFLIAAAFVGLTIRVYGDFARICFLGPCRRTTNAFALFTFMLAGVAIYAAAGKVPALFGGVSPKIKKLCYLLIAFGLAVGFIAALDYTALKNKGDIINKYVSLETGGIRAAEWLAMNADREKKVYALPWNGKGIFVVSGMNVSPTLITRLGTFDLKMATQKAREEQVLIGIIDFFEMNCEGKYSVLEKSGAEWIYSPQYGVECAGMDKLYQGSSENHSLYRASGKDI